MSEVKPGSPAGERGVAMVVVLASLVVLALLAAALAQGVLVEVESERLVQQDQRAAYLAEAAVEHQIALLAQDRTAGRVQMTQLASPAMASGAEHRYQVQRLRCLPHLSVECTPQDSPGERRCQAASPQCGWGIEATGEIAVDGNVVQARTLCVEAVLQYPSSGQALPVKVWRWLRAAGSTCRIPEWDLP